MNEWWRELKTESAQNKVRCSELLSAKRSISYGSLWKLQNWYGIAPVGVQGLLLTWYHHFKSVSISVERCLSWNIFFKSTSYKSPIPLQLGRIFINYLPNWSENLFKEWPKKVGEKSMTNSPFGIYGSHEVIYIAIFYDNPTLVWKCFKIHREILSKRKRNVFKFALLQHIIRFAKEFFHVNLLY